MSPLRSCLLYAAAGVVHLAWNATHGHYDRLFVRKEPKLSWAVARALAWPWYLALQLIRRKA